MDREDWAGRVLEAVAARPGPSQVTVIRRGQVELDQAIRCGADALFMSFSAMKPLVSVLIHQLVERGEPVLDQPVSWVWPEFARRGKRPVTVRDILQHRSGLDLRLPELLRVTSVPLAPRLVAALPARRPPGEGPNYQVLSYGVVLGEVCRRITGRGLGELLEERILAPLGLAGQAFLGLPEEQDHRGIRLSGAGPLFGAVAAVARQPAVRRAPIASGGLWTSSRVLAHFYDALGANLAGHDVLPDLPAHRVAEMITQSSDGVDGTTGLVTRWANGVQLGGTPGSFFGSRSGTTTFGHNGSNICIGFHDQDRGVSMALMTSHLAAPKKTVRHFQEVADRVLAG